VVLIRILNPVDAPQFREERLESLRGADADFFTASREEEEARQAESWKKICTQSSERVFVGAFLEDRLVGFSGARLWEQDGAGMTVYWGPTYVTSAHRQCGVMSSLYDARLEWSRRHGYCKAYFVIRKGNTTSFDFYVERHAECCGGEPRMFGGNLVAAWHCIRCLAD